MQFVVTTIIMMFCIPVFLVLFALGNNYFSFQVGESVASDICEARARLESFIQTAAGSKQPVPALPDSALRISGKTYLLEPDFLGWSEMTFHFEPESDEAILSMSDSPDLKTGLDNLYRLTKTSKGRPTGLRGRWSKSDTFYLDYSVFGDFIRSEAQIQFDGSKITVTINYLNWNSPPVVLHGKMQE